MKEIQFSSTSLSISLFYGWVMSNTLTFVMSSSSNLIDHEFIHDVLTIPIPKVSPPQPSKLRTTEVTLGGESEEESKHAVV